MKSIDLSISPATLTELLDLASQENLILKTPDGREFVLAEVDDLADEIALIRKNDELMDLLAERSKEPGKYSLAEVKSRLGI